MAVLYKQCVSGKKIQVFNTRKIRIPEFKKMNRGAPLNPPFYHKRDKESRPNVLGTQTSPFFCHVVFIIFRLHIVRISEARIGYMNIYGILYFPIKYCDHNILCHEPDAIPFDRLKDGKPFRYTLSHIQDKENAAAG
jgi:hypothetical protein